MTPELKALAECRARVDAVDRKLLALLNERTEIVEEIGRIKRSAGMAIYEPAREEEVFRNVQEHNAGPLTSEAVKRVFERIIDEMRGIQRARMESSRDGE